jgi:hypothetical protein
MAQAALPRRKATARRAQPVDARPRLSTVKRTFVRGPDDRIAGFRGRPGPRAGIIRSGISAESSSSRDRFLGSIFCVHHGGGWSSRSPLHLPPRESRARGGTGAGHGWPLDASRAFGSACSLYTGLITGPATRLREEQEQDIGKGEISGHQPRNSEGAPHAHLA